jgi:hypothetical protein
VPMFRSTGLSTSPSVLRVDRLWKHCLPPSSYLRNEQILVDAGNMRSSDRPTYSIIQLVPVQLKCMGLRIATETRPARNTLNSVPCILDFPDKVKNSGKA